jgi:hypothetical protein
MNEETIKERERIKAIVQDVLNNKTAQRIRAKVVFGKLKQWALFRIDNPDYIPKPTSWRALHNPHAVEKV